MPKWLIVVIILLVIIIGLGVAGYGYFFGFTKKQKYVRCADTCEKAMLNEGNIPLCKIHCEEITNYNPRKDTATKTATPTPTAKVTTGTTTTTQSQYGCEWSWPQKVINNNTKEVIQSCDSLRPYCKYGVTEQKDLACCTSAVKNAAGATTYTDCQTISQ